MGVWIAVIVVAVVVVAVAAYVLARRRAAAAPPAVESTPEPTRRIAIPEPAPMTDLESALNQVTDRSGRSFRERIDAEDVDDLRVPDDTGPLLRRALDSVAHDDDGEGDEGEGDEGEQGDDAATVIDGDDRDDHDDRPADDGHHDRHGDAPA